MDRVGLVEAGKGVERALDARDGHVLEWKVGHGDLKEMLLRFLWCCLRRTTLRNVGRLALKLNLFEILSR